MGILNFLSKYSCFNLFILGLVFTVYAFLEVESQEENVVHNFQPPPQPSTPPPPPPPPLQGMNMSPPPLSLDSGNALPPPPPPPLDVSNAPPPETLNVGSLLPPLPESLPLPLDLSNALPPETLNVRSWLLSPTESPPSGSKFSPPSTLAGRHRPPHSPSPNRKGTPNKPPQWRRRRPPPPPHRDSHARNRGLNTGKTVGIVFAGFAAVLQVCVVTFLVFKRKQLLR